MDHGETLTSYLIQVGVAKERPDHHVEVMRDLLLSTEPNQCE